MPTLPDGIRRAFRLALQRPPIEKEVDAEIAFHLEMRAADLTARGLTPDAARDEARRRFGDTHYWSMAMSAIDRERTADERRTEWLGDLRQDLRYGVRGLLRAPLFSLLAVATLALGIGANAAVFGVLKSVLLDALPYTNAERLVRVYHRMLDGSVDRVPMSPWTVNDITTRQRSFERLAAFESLPREAVFTGDGSPSVVKVAWTEPGLFGTLGVRAALGRTLTSEDAESDTAHVVMVTHAGWQRLLGGDPGVLSRAVRINGVSRTVAGVLPRDFVGPLGGDVDFYFPLNLQPALRDPVGGRRRQWLGVVGRLKAGVSVDAAEREVVAIVADIAREYPRESGSFTASVMPVRDDMVGDTRTPLLVLMGSAALVLLITCANLAGALLSRTLSRRKEFAVRVALGAGRGRLVRQLLTESTVLALIGGAAGMALAMAGLAALRGLAVQALPAYAELSLDTGALLFTLGLAVCTGLTFGIAPALSVRRSDVQATLREETRGASESGRSRRLRGALVAGQIALCVSLLAGAGLLARSLWAITTAPLGFNARGIMTMGVQLPRASHETAQARVRFIDQYEEHLRAIPGVADVAVTGELPTRLKNRNGFSAAGAPVRPSDAKAILLSVEVSDHYFRTLGIPLRGGRTFDERDGLDAPLRLILSQSVAQQYWPSGTAVGARVHLGGDSSGPEATVIGVVGDVYNDPAQPKPEPMMYMSVRQAPWNGPIFMVRTHGDPLSILRPARAALAALDPGLPLHNPMTMESLLATGLAGRRLPVMLMTAFGVLALLLASVGIYAMFAAMAAAREREFGVRIALGASRGGIATLVLRQGGAWMAAGLVGGAIGVVLVSRLVRGLLYGVPPFDPVALGVAVMVLLACAVVALLIPVRRAMRVDPITVLR